MKPTSDDFAPRRDGWFEHEATWEEVTVGTILADPGGSRTKRWEVIATAHGDQVAYGYTLWMRIREALSGEEHTIKPRLKVGKVIVLTQDPADTETAPPSPPSDTEAIMLLVQELGAEVMAQRDEGTGEVVCPNYATGANHLVPGDRQLQRGLAEHLRFAHGMTVDDSDDIAPLIHLHGQAHDKIYPDIGKGGFPHRHAPETKPYFGGIAK